MADPTYVQAEIDADPAWKVAWVLSEIFNDRAPIGWGEYIFAAEQIIAKQMEDEETDNAGLTEDQAHHEAGYQAGYKSGVDQARRDERNRCVRIILDQGWLGTLEARNALISAIENEQS